MDWLLELAWLLLVGAIGIVRKTRSPLLGGVFAGLPGAICGAFLLGLFGYELGVLTPAGSDIWLPSAVVGAALVGYPLGAFGGILIVGKRRSQTGSHWLALLGALVGTSLGVGLYQGYELAEQRLLALPPWVGFLVLSVPVVLIPSLIWLGYGSRTTFKKAEHLQQLTSEHEVLRQDRTATIRTGPASDSGSSRVKEGAQSNRCSNCDASNPAGSAFCGECGAPIAMSRCRAEQTRRP